MYKKLFLLSMIAFAAVLSPVAISAQHTPGSWKKISMKGESISSVVDTPDKVYYITGGSMYAYDKNYNETTYFAPGSQLSDNGIKMLRYNKDGKYLAVVYTNSNIDLIYDDGRIVNLPEISEANLTSDRNINELAFKNGLMYVATDFGITVFDDKKHQVVESGVYNKKVNHIGATDKYLVLICEGNMYYSPVKDRHNKLENFKKKENFGFNTWQYVSGERFIYVPAVNATSKLYALDLDLDNDNLIINSVCDAPNVSSIMPYSAGFYMIAGNDFYMLDEKGEYKDKKNIPSAIFSGIGSTWKGIDRLWSVTADGLGLYDISGSQVSVISEPYVPAGSMMFRAAFSTPMPDGSGSVTTTMGQSSQHPSGCGYPFADLPVIIEKYDWATGEITPLHPIGVKNFFSYTQAEQNKAGGSLFYGGAATTVIDPVDPSLVYHSNTFDGLIVLRDNKVYHRFHTGNSGLLCGWGARVQDAAIDQMGNLWVGTWNDKALYQICPAASLEKFRKDPEAIDKSEWLNSKLTYFGDPVTDLKIMFPKNTTRGIFIRGTYAATIMGYDHKGTLSPNDDSVIQYSGLLDQDGIVTTPANYYSFTLDANGHVWLATSAGVFIVKDLDQLGYNRNNGNLAVIRPKVPRNDGTIYADYLLPTDNVMWIASDASNRKWIATYASGLYLVNEDGTQILEHFTKDNSPLLSNAVLTVDTDPNGNDVLISTPEGMYVYSGTSAPAAESFDEVYAFPNPVRPDYHGWITINGLMDNSLVKIADIQGNVFWEGRSEGGMAVWDGCNRDGSRVKSGVYMVYASQNADGSNSGAVTKIVVVK